MNNKALFLIIDDSELKNSFSRLNKFGILNNLKHFDNKKSLSDRFGLECKKCNSNNVIVFLNFFEKNQNIYDESSIDFIVETRLLASDYPVNLVTYLFDDLEWYDKQIEEFFNLFIMNFIKFPCSLKKIKESLEKLIPPKEKDLEKIKQEFKIKSEDRHFFYDILGKIKSNYKF